MFFTSSYTPWKPEEFKFYVEDFLRAYRPDGMDEDGARTCAEMISESFIDRKQSLLLSIDEALWFVGGEQRREIYKLINDALL